MDYDRPVSPAEARRISLTTGVLFLITFITSIPALWLYQPVLDDPVGYVAGAGHDNRIFLAVFLELILIIANIGTAVVPYPLLKRQDEALALGFVTARIMESTFILVGILSVLAVVSLQQDVSPADQRSFGDIAYTLAAIKDWTFLLGPGFVVGIGNGLLHATAPTSTSPAAVPAHRLMNPSPRIDGTCVRKRPPSAEWPRATGRGTAHTSQRRLGFAR